MNLTMNKRLILIAIVSLLMLSIVALAASAKRGPARILGKYDQVKTGKGKYYQFTQGDIWTEKRFTPLSGVKQPRVSSLWKARSTSTIVPVRNVITRHVRFGGQRYSTEQESVRQHRYARRTLGGNQVKEPVTRKGRFYRSSGETDAAFTDLVTGKKVK